MSSSDCIVFTWRSALVVARTTFNAEVPISILAFAWDHASDEFVARQSWHVPLSGDVELAAAGVVSDYETGMYQAYVVLLNEVSFWVGFLDFDEECLQLITQIPLMNTLIVGSMPAKCNEVLKGCWITNGPTLVAFGRQKLLIAHPMCISKKKRLSRTNTNSSHVECDWEVVLLNLSSNEEDHVNVFHCGELRSGLGPEVIISFTNSFISQSKGSPLNKPSYVRLDLLSLPWSITNVTSIEMDFVNAEDSVWQKSSSDLVAGHLSQIIPTDLDPSIISCITFLPEAPWLTTPSVSQPSSSDVSAADVPSDVVIGTTDKRLIRCKNGEVTAVLDMEDVPCSIQFAITTGGLGVLFVKSDTLKGRVVAICLKGYRQLQGWTGIEKVGIGDYQMVGHEQVVLLRKHGTFQSPHPSTTGPFFVDLVVTDLEHWISAGPNNETITDEFVEDQRVQSIKSMINVLEARHAVGVSLLKDAKNKMEKKMELLGSSCRLMQTLSGQHGLLGDANKVFQVEADTLTETKNAIVSIIRIEGVYSMISGRVLTILVHIKSIAPRMIALRNVHLVLTTLQGHIQGRSSSLELLLPDDGVKHLVVVVPLEIAILKHQILNVLLTAVASSIEEHKRCACGACNLCFPCKDEHHSQGVAGRRSNTSKLESTFVQWILTLHLNESVLSDSCKSGLSPVCRREVCSRHQLWVRNVEAKSANLFEITKETLEMLERPVCQTANSPLARGKELVARGLFAWADASILCCHDTSMITLRAGTSTDLELMLHLLVAQLKSHHFDVLPKLWNPNRLEFVRQVAHALTDEITSILSLQQSIQDAGKGQHPSEGCPYTFFSNARKAQTLTDQLLITLLSFNG